MKRFLAIFLVIAFMFCLFTGCDSDSPVVGTMPPKDETGDDTSMGYTLDYADAESFEAALNSGAKVNGKVVQFVVNDYKPESILGINCWAGEHLNFISENELDVAAGAIIIGRITEEPSKILGSWKVPYEPLVIAGAKAESDETRPSTTEESTITETTSSTVIANQVFTPVSHKGTVGLSGEDVVTLFTEAGFTNITMEELKLDYDPEVDYESGYCKSVAINGEYFFEENVPFDADVPIVVLYVTYPENVSPTIQPTVTIETEPPTDSNPYNKVGSYVIYTKNEYAHIESDVIRLGNGERVWITIEASPSTLTMDDFIVDYDDTMLEIIDVTNSTSGNTLEIELVVSAKHPGVSEIVICSGYELYEDAENAMCYVLTVNGLDSSDGRIVYVTSTGEKYHFSASCVSSGIKTTLSDALAYEYEPCSKCVN